MIKNYSGNTKPFAAVLCAADAKEKAEGLLGQLAKRGLNLCIEDGSRACKGKTARAFATIALLSEGFAKSENLQEALFAADSAGRAIIPVHTDGAVQNDGVNRILFARNALFAENYANDEELADRIFNGSVLEHPVLTVAQKKSRRYSILETAAGAIVIAAASLAMIFGGGNTDSAPPEAPSVDPGFFDTQGITAEELEKITHVLMIGDRFIYSTYEEPHIGKHFDYASRGFEQDENGEDIPHFYWHEDGSTVETQHYDNIDFITLLPNLESLEIVCIDTPALPDVSGMSSLNDVDISDCTLTDISGLAGSQTETFSCSITPVTDYSPLTLCDRLGRVEINLHTLNSADFSGFAPPNLIYLKIEHGDRLRSIDLSALENCGRMSELDLRRLPLDNIDFAAGMPELKTLYLEDINGITDITPLGGCSGLKSAVFQDLYNLHDISALGQLKHMEYIAAHCQIYNLDFLKEMAPLTNFSLAFSRPMNDYSGLAAVTSFDSLHCNLSGGDYSLVQDYLKDKEINRLALYEVNSIDLSQIPDTASLELANCGIRDLAGLKNLKVDYLTLYDMQLLRSLDGIESLTGLSTLEIRNCPRLTDFDSLCTLKLKDLRLDGLAALPDFNQLQFTKRFYLYLANIYGINTLDFLDGITTDEAKNSVTELDISGLNNIYDLSPLYNVNGWKLFVRPELGGQAEDVVENGKFKNYEIKYPENGWGELRVELYSLEDLDTLPAALLENVEFFMMCGDEVNGRGWFEHDENDRYYFSDEEGNNLGYVGESPLADLTKLSSMTGLRDLNLSCQTKLKTLEGIQSMQQLESLTVSECHQLTDITPAFALGGITYLDMQALPIQSIEGIENLYGLETAVLAWNDSLTDLTPLLKLPNLQRVEVSSNMEEAIAGLDGQDYSFELIIRN